MIKNFTFQSPTKLIFGKGSIGALKREIPPDKNILLLFGGSSLKTFGTYDKIKDALSNREFLTEYSGIEPNPEYEQLLDCVDIVRKNNINYILAAGGGSVIDAAKFVALAALYEGNPWHIVETFGACCKAALPLSVIVTLPASGSEVNRDTVISRVSKKAKLPVGNSFIYPQFAILDPTLTYTLPEEQTANGILDTFVHVLEQYLTTDLNAKLQDRFAESILLTLIEEAPIVLSEPENYDSRSNIMLCSSMAMNGFLRAGVQGDWSSHMISHELTTLLGLPHARALAVIVPLILNYCIDSKKDKLVRYAREVWHISDCDKNKLAHVAIEKTVEFFHQLGFKTKLSDYSVGEKEIDKLVKQLISHQMIKLGENRNITPDVVRGILVKG